MSFSVRILGSGSAVPTSRRKLTSQYIECRGRHFLLDCGEGTQSQMRKYKVHFQKIDHIFISHLHGDHFFGLVGLLSTMHLMGRKRTVSIYGPPELEQILKLQLNYGGAKLSYELIFYPTNLNGLNLLFEDDKVEVLSFPVKHRVPTTGFLIREKEQERVLLVDVCREQRIPIEYYHRFKKGEDVVDEEHGILNHLDFTSSPPRSRAYAFTADTKYAESIVPFIQGVDVLYHEATFLKALKDRAKATMHSTAEQAARIAKIAGVKRLFMGHLSARYDSGELHQEEAQLVFKESYVVEDGELIHL